MLVHLFNECGDIDDNAVADNEQRMVETWDGAEQLETVFARIDEYIE
jgi:hypothetical protein